MNAVRRSALLVALILSMAAPTAVQADMGSDLPNEGGIGAVAALSTLIYGPAKLCYATLGCLIGGSAWGLSGGDQEVLEAVVTPGRARRLRRDAPAHPHGAQLEFYGRDPQYREVQQASAAPPAHRLRTRRSVVRLRSGPVSTVRRSRGAGSSGAPRLLAVARPGCFAPAMASDASPHILLAFAAGLLSVLSPCVLPLMPAYLSLVSGLSVDELREGESDAVLRRRVMRACLGFVAGFSLVFVAARDRRGRRWPGACARGGSSSSASRSG